MFRVEKLNSHFVNLTNEADGLLGDLERETDRGAALLGVAFIDDVLDAVLRAHFVDDEKAVHKLLGPGRPVESFGTRTHLAFCLGLLGPDTYSDMNLIREIRNEFAHRQPVSFEGEMVKSRIERLRAVDVLAGGVPMTCRERFVVSVVLIVNHLAAFGHTVTRARVGKDFTSNGMLRLR
ncbi:MAG TPA: MltR family transcriptional regulator [Tepidisphaeraceae bacterium]|jgi:DNA-binding MltR family transcriptional regulator|nr:MltR family transcriptional regulator [Tepidisphaeraceae bacterium]